MRKTLVRGIQSATVVPAVNASSEYIVGSSSPLCRNEAALTRQYIRTLDKLIAVHPTAPETVPAVTCSEVTEADVIELLEYVFKQKFGTFEDWYTHILQNTDLWASPHARPNNSLSAYKYFYTEINRGMELEEPEYKMVLAEGEREAAPIGFNAFVHKMISGEPIRSRALWTHLGEMWELLPEEVRSVLCKEEGHVHDQKAINTMRDEITAWVKENTVSQLLSDDLLFWSSQECDGHRKEIALSEVADPLFRHSAFTAFADLTELTVSPVEVAYEFITKTDTATLADPIPNIHHAGLSRSAMLPIHHFHHERMGSDPKWKTNPKQFVSPNALTRELWAAMPEKKKLPYYLKARRYSNSTLWGHPKGPTALDVFTSETGLLNKAKVLLGDHRQAYYERQSSMITCRYITPEFFSGGTTGVGVYASGAGNAYIETAQIKESYQLLTLLHQASTFEEEALENEIWVERNRYSWNSPYHVCCTRIYERTQFLLNDMQPNLLMVALEGTDNWNSLSSKDRNVYSEMCESRFTQWDRIKLAEIDDDIWGVTPLCERLTESCTITEEATELDNYIYSVMAHFLSYNEAQHLPLSFTEIISQELRIDRSEAFNIFQRLCPTLVIYYKKKILANVALLSDIYTDDITDIAANACIDDLSFIDFSQFHDILRLQIFELTSHFNVLLSMAVAWEHEDMYYKVLQTLLKYGTNRYLDSENDFVTDAVEKELLDRVQERTGMKLPLYKPLTKPEYCPPFYHHAIQKGTLTAADIFHEYTGRDREEFPTIPQEEKESYDLPFLKYTFYGGLDKVTCAVGEYPVFHTLVASSALVVDYKGKLSTANAREQLINLLGIVEEGENGNDEAD